VTTLASCLLRNDGKGRFTVEPLPRRAQIAPIFGMVALGDLLVCAPNSFAPEPETGHHDGSTGLVLHGGKDGITVVAPQDHGLAVLGDHKALVAHRSGERTGLVFARNHGALHAHTLAVVAAPAPAGAPGNPQAIGARLRVTTADGAVRAVERHAGGSYLSHTPDWFPLPAGTTAVRSELRQPDGRIELVEARR